MKILQTNDNNEWKWFTGVELGLKIEPYELKFKQKYIMCSRKRTNI